MLTKIKSLICLYWKTISIFIAALVITILSCYFLFIKPQKYRTGMQTLSSQDEIEGVKSIEIEIDGIERFRVPENALSKISINPNENINLIWEKKRSILRKYDMSLQMFRYLNNVTHTKELKVVKGPFYLRYSRRWPAVKIALDGFNCARLDNYAERETGGDLPGIPKGKYMLTKSIANLKNFNLVYDEFPLIFVHVLDGDKGNIAVVPKNRPDNLRFKEALKSNLILELDNDSFKFASGLLLKGKSYIKLEHKIDNLLKMKELLAPIGKIRGNKETMKARCSEAIICYNRLQVVVAGTPQNFFSKI